MDLMLQPPLPQLMSWPSRGRGWGARTATPTCTRAWTSRSAGSKKQPSLPPSQLVPTGSCCGAPAFDAASHTGAASRAGQPDAGDGDGRDSKGASALAQDLLLGMQADRAALSPIVRAERYGRRHHPGTTRFDSPVPDRRFRHSALPTALWGLRAGWSETGPCAASPASPAVAWPVYAVTVVLAGEGVGSRKRGRQRVVHPLRRAASSGRCAREPVAAPRGSLTGLRCVSDTTDRALPTGASCRQRPEEEPPG
jgi:hypothetical protein